MENLFIEGTKAKARKLNQERTEKAQHFNQERVNNKKLFQDRIEK